MNLISEKSILDITGRIIVQNNHNDATHHFSDLMIDKTLSNNVEDKCIFIKFLCVEVENISLRFGIFCFEVFGIIMKIMCANEIFTASIHFLEELG